MYHGECAARLMVRIRERKIIAIEKLVQVGLPSCYYEITHSEQFI